jgi:hypothetical protein
MTIIFNITVLVMRTISDISVEKNQNTHSVLQYFFQKISPFYKIMLENMAQPGKSQKII